MEVRLTELRYREVINISDGTRLGFVSDAILDLTSGRVLALIVPGPARFFGLFGRESDYILPWASAGTSFSSRAPRRSGATGSPGEVSGDKNPGKSKYFFKRERKGLQSARAFGIIPAHYARGADRRPCGESLVAPG